MNDWQFPKLFTVDEANQTLPLVKKIVADILHTGQLLRAFAREYGEAARQMPAFQEHMRQLQQFVEELEALGCFFKDWNFEIGLVDFPAVLNGKVVFLCWRSDEPAIQYYHDIEAGYAGRQPLPGRGEAAP